MVRISPARSGSERLLGQDDSRRGEAAGRAMGQGRRFGPPSRAGYASRVEDGEEAVAQPEDWVGDLIGGAAQQAVEVEGVSRHLDQ